MTIIYVRFIWFLSFKVLNSCHIVVALMHVYGGLDWGSTREN